MDAEARQALQDLERVLLDAVFDSPDAALALQQLQARGYSLYLAVDHGGETPREPKTLSLPAPPPGPSSRPSFRIDGRDLTFLRSIGIDPTRRARRRAR